jgi:hypothetical protein
MLGGMCRNIKKLHHFEPTASAEEMRASALQYVRKLSGMQRPSRANEAAFQVAVERVYEATRQLLAELEANGPARSRDEERQKAVERGRKREAQTRAKVLRSLA